MDLCWDVSHLRLILLVLYPCFLWCLFLTSCRQSLYDSSGNNSRIWLSSTYLLSEKRITSLFAEYHKSNEPKLHHNMLLRLILKRVSFKRFICPRVQAPPCLTQFSIGYPVSRLVHQGFLSRPVPLWLPWTQCSMILSGSHSRHPGEISLYSLVLVFIDPYIIQSHLTLPSPCPLFCQRLKNCCCL